jgi:peptidoglycan/LPS O-acetylase OafA/YrhL
MKSKRQKLNALTSLRFVAAALIVFSHFDGLFGFPASFSRSFYFHHGVSFFFILSGFILTYAYPSLNNWQEVKKFLITRMARIWPMHCLLFSIVGLLSLGGLIDNLGRVPSALVNILLVHGWVPSVNSFFSYNSPSWSISIEFFFYLCFPLLIHQLSTSWIGKALIIFSLPIPLLFICAYFQLPDYSPTYSGITNYGLLYINPLMRLPEFFIGILGAFLWENCKNSIENYHRAGTALELSALTLLSLNISFYSTLQQWMASYVPQAIAHEFEIWIHATGILSCLSFLFIILVFTHQKGLISKFFSLPFSVLLGEISFSMYLIHQIFNRVYLSYASLFAGMPNQSKFVIYWILLLACSYFTWKFIEYPLRNLIVKAYV